jgi:AcrR family transcriptional regulator
MIVPYMAPPRKHDTDAILDAARARVLAEGPRSASVAAIAQDSGAPVGTLYHRFGNRDGVLVAVWLRALERFQAGALAAAQEDDPLESAVAMARAAVDFAARHPLDAELLLAVRRRDLVDNALPERLGEMNAPLQDALARVARGLFGRADARNLDRVAQAVVDLPTGAVRRHGGRIPRWLAGDVGRATRALLSDPGQV